MLDRNGRPIRKGELVSVIGHDELSIKVNWIIMGLVDQGLATEVILQNFISGEITYINILDIEKE